VVRKHMWTNEQRKVWDTLHQRTCTLFAVWELYRALFGCRETVQRMNVISGTGFRFIQECMVHEQIRIAMALTDGEGQENRPNLSIKRLLGMLECDNAKNAHVKLAAIEEPLAVLRSHRNKRLQHFDLNTVTGVHALPELLTDHLDDAIKGIGEVMSEISLACINTQQGYDHILINNANGALRWMISDSVRLKKLREISRDDGVTDSQVRQLLRNRSDRHDREILGHD